MKIIKPSFKEMFNNNPQKHIELIARTCYKSEDKITEDSHKVMMSNLYKNKHWAMLEHFIFIIEIKIPSTFYTLQRANLKYFNFTDHFDLKKERKCYLVSCSARGILDILKNHNNFDDEILEHISGIKRQIIFNYECYELFGSNIGNDYSCFDIVNDISEYDIKNQLIHGWHSVKFICDRGVSHEIVRHRDASFAQESTRYCNYAKDKFGKEITVIKPCYLKDDSDDSNNEMVAWGVWKRAIENSEKSYFEMLDLGCNSQEARAVLPNSLKTEIIMTAHNYEWEHFFELRCDKAAHPQMRELALPLLQEFSLNYPLIFSDIKNKFKNDIIERN